MAIHRQHIHKVALGGAMTEGSNPTDRGKLGTKRHILTDKKGIPLSAVISSAGTHDIKLVTNVVDSMVIERPSPSSKPKTERRKRGRLQQHLCLDKAYNSEPEASSTGILFLGCIGHHQVPFCMAQSVDQQSWVVSLLVKLP